jgi:hypothetical protein
MSKILMVEVRKLGLRGATLRQVLVWVFASLLNHLFSQLRSEPITMNRFIHPTIESILPYQIVIREPK